MVTLFCRKIKLSSVKYFFHAKITPKIIPKNGDIGSNIYQRAGFDIKKDFILVASQISPANPLVIHVTYLR
jgi:hypothetical protein